MGLYWCLFSVELKKLRCNLYTIRFTFLKCAIKWFLVYSEGCATINTIWSHISFFCGKTSQFIVLYSKISIHNSTFIRVIFLPCSQPNNNLFSLEFQILHCHLTPTELFSMQDSSIFSFASVSKSLSVSCIWLLLEMGSPLPRLASNSQYPSLCLLKQGLLVCTTLPGLSYTFLILHIVSGFPQNLFYYSNT